MIGPPCVPFVRLQKRGSYFETTISPVHGEDRFRTFRLTSVAASTAHTRRLENVGLDGGSCRNNAALKPYSFPLPTFATTPSLFCIMTLGSLTRSVLLSVLQTILFISNNRPMCVNPPVCRSYHRSMRCSPCLEADKMHTESIGGVHSPIRPGSMMPCRFFCSEAALCGIRPTSMCNQCRAISRFVLLTSLAHL